MTVVYHYTSGSSLESIFRNGCFWATDVRNMNDQQELTYAASRLSRGIDNVISNVRDASDAPTYLPNPGALRRQALEYIRNMVSDPSFGDTRNGVYATCFTTLRDKLSQWRGYAREDGYAIGIDKDSLAALDTGVPRTGSLVDVIYGDDSRAIDALLETIIAGVGRASHPRGALNVFNDVVLPNVARVKHEGFSEEAETRLVRQVHPNDSRVVYSNIGGRIVIHFDIPITKMKIVEVIVGPGPDQGARGVWVKRLLAETLDMVEPIDVRSSAIPLRV